MLYLQFRVTLIKALAENSLLTDSEEDTGPVTAPAVGAAVLLLSVQLKFY